VTLADLGALLNVLIVLIAVYLMLSLLCSTVREAVAAYVDSRAKLLRLRLEEILSPGGAAELLDTAIIRGLAPPGRTPTYIPSVEFATAVIGMLQDRSAYATGAMHPAFRTLYEEAKAAAGGDPAKALDEFRTRLAVWYDHAMERLSGNYKRLAQVWMFCLGLAFAAAFNIDSFHLVGALWQDRAQLEPIADQIQKWREAHITKDGSTIADDQAAQDELKRILATLPPSVKLPIGWEFPDHIDDFGTALKTVFGNLWNAVRAPSGWLTLVGWLITALAVIPGAQFWFDRLGDVVSLRATGKKPPTLRETEDKS
jgi:hypothetical protein